MAFDIAPASLRHAGPAPSTERSSFEAATEARPLARTRLLVARVSLPSPALRQPALDLRDARFADFVAALDPSDVCVVNDAATLPASIFATLVGPNAMALELRLLGPPDARGEADALLFGAGDWHTPTEHRAPPPTLHPGDELRSGTLAGTIVSVDSSGRIARIGFGGTRDEVVRAIYAVGGPVQYAHIPERLPLWEVQNGYASEPWAVEMPSAGRPLDFATIGALRARGIHVVHLTHGAGLSSTGDVALDASLPWVERYRIPAHTARAVSAAVAHGGRIIAVGTSVVRALEASFLRFGEVRPGEATTDLRIDSSHHLRVAGGLLTGMHDATTSHANLLAAFLPGHTLEEVTAHALRQGYLGHEFGDSCLILRA